MGEMKHTPEEIKKGLEMCAAEKGGCMGCPYRHDSMSGCITLKASDALAYIQQLEAKVSALEKRCDAEQLNATYAITEMAEVKSRCLRSIEIISKALRHEYGWSIGNVVLCPDCVTKIKEQRNANKQQTEGRKV